MARRDLAGEALFLARLVAGLLPDEPEALGLLAFLLYAQARHGARRNEAGDYVPLAGQDLAQWDWQMIREAESLLQRAAAMGGVGRYPLEAAVQSAHVHRRSTGRDNWQAVVQLYDGLLVLTGSPVVALNRAIAVAEWQGAEAGLEAMRGLAGNGQMDDYQPCWAARAELLGRMGRHDEARHADDIATGLARDPAVCRFLRQRRMALPR